MTEEFQGRLFPKEAADAIGIATATLRKYSQIIEEVIEDPDFFTRTEQNNRTYSQRNIELLKDISQMSTDTKKPVKTIVEQLKKEEPERFSTEDTMPSTVTTEQLDQSSVSDFVKIIEQQNQKIDQLMQMMVQMKQEMHQEFDNVKPALEHQTIAIEEKSTQETPAENKQESSDKAQPTDKQKENSEKEEQVSKDDEATSEKEEPSKEEAKAPISEAQPEEKVGFFKRLFGKK